ncbi:hypothetical protein VD0002_g474 [Verticillium dahliae]|uniref:C2H2-type domain-containing protein n=2 Tax=Verticillium dahliae TaxID=27337 RepID=G2X9Y8_VERDV|nr:uncharacterized protein VDAG_06891 [Verticillium dahliae VdLs.17]KAH6702392.1 hypothetical protein EV126DRAFT_225741 [Verticillium dahliae]EGY15727.1 hypothetical protein VDAG_06891 [Verticillium dahliae VdLs.17]PNH36657.1 hypothetical protein BJF96_g284 [Verticillium dahliae]PNH56753.1 hypothetical protein VD0003_g963 [Verticillium dahliae]PNH70083.1 hypothetical protein VD0002_g474 [Verticillium dahliae]
MASTREPKATPATSTHSRKHIKTGQHTLDTFFAARPAGALNTTSPKKLRPSFQPTTIEPQTPTSSTFEIVLGSSTPKQRATAPFGAPHAAGGDDDITSDLSPQFRRLAAQAAQPVSLSKPASPAVSKISNHAPVARSSPEAETATAAAAAAAAGPSSRQKRRRGRPKGYRPSLGRIVGEDEADALQPNARQTRTPKAVSYYTGKRRGRPPKAEAPGPREVYETLAPRFLRFVCEWAGCSAELHNFETLRRHVSVVHAPTGRQKVCQWARCRQGRREFATAEEMRAHLEEVHMPPIVWQAGEGPVITAKKYIVDDATGELPRYLFDKTGVQVTPSVRDQQLEDIPTYRANRKKLRMLLLLRDQNLTSEVESGEDGELEGPVA